ncbi:MAG: S41 family peptidase [Verrucomicrobiota bacterium JB023]|nr:S41 family peptidase [Verrucomicrobiota bacterium JB023]
MNHLLALIFLLPLQAQDSPPPLPDAEQGYEQVERFIQVLEEVRAHHPDAEKLSYERLVNHALEGMLGSLDPFSSFYHPETAPYLDPNAPADEQFLLPGLGISLGQRENEFYLSSVREHSPAAEAGLRRDDILLKVNAEELSGFDLPATVRALSGPAGQTVKLQLYRPLSRETLEVSLLRSVIKQEPLPDHYLLEESGDHRIGYVRLTEFTATAPAELEAALDELEDQGMRSLILDLRGNPGGLLDASVKILGLFLPPGKEVVTIRGRSPRANHPALSTPDRQRVKRDYPLVVLLDRQSASASELTAAALRDLERATIVGETSFGKGSVQSINPQPGGTAIRLTYATYHTPSGKTPHLVGVTPDIEVPWSDDDRAKFELFKNRRDATAEQAASLETWTDPILEAAMKELQ